MTMFLHVHHGHDGQKMTYVQTVGCAVKTDIKVTDSL